MSKKKLKFSSILMFLIRVVEGFIRLPLFLIAAVLILVLAYFLGYSYLEEIRGTDSFNALNTIHWLARWWPNIPYWYTGQGGGVSLVWGYPMLASIMVVVLSTWQNLNLTAAFRLLGFLSLPLTAIGMYLFVWLRLKNQTVALVSAVFYLLIPISWIWLYDWGFYAEGIASIFIFPSLFFYDRFLEGFIKWKFDRNARISLFVATIFLSLSFAAHPMVFFAVIRIIGIYSPIYFLLKKKKIKGFLIGFLPALIIILLSVFATMFLIGNFQYYSSATQANSGSTMLGKEDYIAVTSIPFNSFLGFARLVSGDFKFAVVNAVMPVLVWLPAIIGTILALLFSAKIFSLALVGWLSLLLVYKPEIVYFFVSKTPFISYFVGIRTETLILRILLPVVAAFGIWAIPGLVLKLMTFWLRFKNIFLKWALRTIIGVISGAVTLGAAAYLVFYFADQPLDLWQKHQIRYGPRLINVREPFVEILFEDEEESTRSSLILESKLELWQELAMKLEDQNYWPELDLSRDYIKIPYDPDGIFPYNNLKDFNQKFGNDQFLRLDVSPTAGGVTQTLNIYNQASMINLYAIQLNLLGPYWGHQQQVAFSVNDGRIETANEIAKWFGTRFLVYNSGADDMDKYIKSKDWRDWDGKKLPNLIKVLEFKESPKLWTLTEDKPSVLMIGDLKKRAYEPVFRASNKGVLPYDDFWLVQGDENLDTYSLDELKQFDILMLFGYHFKSKRKAFGLLDKYLADGGSVFISSGWQYVDELWEGKNLPGFFPAKYLTWTDEYDIKDKYQFDSKLIGKVDTSLFGPLSWGDSGWGVSVASNLQAWAEPILSVDGKPIVLGGNYKKGKVVLSGLNLIGHMHNYDHNQSEIDFFYQIFKWLDSSKAKDLSSSVEAKRDFPDKIEFTFKKDTAKESVFYFRESYFPAWKASLHQGKKTTPVDIYKGGPGFDLMNLPKLSSGDTLVLEFKPGFRQIFITVVSVLSYLGLMVWVIFGKRVFKPVRKLVNSLSKKVKSKAKDAKKDWGKEEDY